MPPTLPRDCWLDIPEALAALDLPAHRYDRLQMLCGLGLVQLERKGPRKGIRVRFVGGEEDIRAELMLRTRRHGTGTRGAGP